jgi:outer membrane protein OmpA-like peptidoglycan-associated protein/Tol biopolymer transport system component
MRFFIATLITFFIVSCGTAQQRYSTKDKKAISFFEEGQRIPGSSADPKTGGPNYRKGIEMMEKAISRDPNFWEAHLVAGEFAEYSSQLELAAKYYESALRINPNHSPSGGTFFFLGTIKYELGDYQAAADLLSKYVSNRNANPDMVKKAREILSSCDFAVQAIKNPTAFNPINVGPGINTKDPEYFPTITVDGKTILFTRRIVDPRLPRIETEPEEYRQRQEDFYVSQLSDKNIWMKAEPMPANINTIRNEGAPTISADGRTLIFVACPDITGKDYGDNRTGRGSCDLFITKRLGSRWIDPVNLPGYVNSAHWETQPSLSADGKTLYFIRGIRGQSGGQNSDIYMSTLQDDGTWGKAERLPDHINTPQAEESVLIHPDGKTLYFASRGHTGMGGSDLYVSRMDEKGNWGKPENLGYPINTRYDENSLMVSADGEIAFFASDRAGGYGGLDIYYFELPEKLRPYKTLYFEGLVYDANTKKPIPGKFQLIDVKTGKEIIRSEADPITGQFMVAIPINHEYALNVSFPGYNFFSQNFNMTVKEGLESFKMDVPMIPIGSGVNVLANVFFDLDKTNLRPESYVELNKLRDVLVQNPSFKIEIGGHTDTRGDDKKNQLLSDGRAKSVRDYLISQGIDGGRLTAKGYGESQPVISDEEIAKMKTSEEQEKAHQKNRRTEYKFIQK